MSKKVATEASQVHGPMTTRKLSSRNEKVVLVDRHREDKASKKQSARLSAALSRSSPGRLLHDAHMRMSAGLVHALRSEGHDLTTEGWAVLSLLSESDELSQLEICERVGKDRHHTSRLIDGLEQQGLVVRKPIADDRRVKVVFMTEKGRDTRRKLLHLVGAYLEFVFDGVSHQDYSAYIRVLEHILSRLPARSQRAEGLSDSPET